MSLAATVLLLALAAAAPDLQAAAAPAGSCGQALPAGPRRLLSSPNQQLAFVTRPEQLRVGRHFSIDFVVCPGPGRSRPLAVQVDAEMPAHKHGMNYRASVRDLGDGRYRAEGLLLHMPGRWRLQFDLSADGAIERLSHELELE
jgi:hypothetical protein